MNLGEVLLGAYGNEALTLAKDGVRLDQLRIIVLAEGAMSVDHHLRWLADERGIKTGHDLSWQLIDAHVVTRIVNAYRSSGGNEDIGPQAQTLAIGAAILIGDPLRGAVGQGDLAINAHAELGDDKWAVGGDALKEGTSEL